MSPKHRFPGSGEGHSNNRETIDNKPPMLISDHIKMARHIEYDAIDKTAVGDNSSVTVSGNGPENEVSKMVRDHEAVFR